MKIVIHLLLDYRKLPIPLPWVLKYLLSQQTETMLRSIKLAVTRRVTVGKKSISLTIIAPVFIFPL